MTARYVLAVFALLMATGSTADADIIVSPIRPKRHRQPTVVSRTMASAPFFLTGTSWGKTERLSLPAAVVRKLARANRPVARPKVGWLLPGLSQPPYRFGIGVGLLAMALGLLLTWRTATSSAATSSRSESRDRSRSRLRHLFLPAGVATSLLAVVLIGSATVSADAPSPSRIRVRSTATVTLRNDNQLRILLPEQPLVRQCRLHSEY